MNYHHLFHAGNFADVFKHTLLVILLKSFHKKETGFFYLDTHAGRDIYDLFSQEANATKEYEAGIVQLMDRQALQRNKKLWPTELVEYVKIIQNCAGNIIGKKPRYYPGSGYIARQLLRAQDRMVLSEINLNEAKRLSQLFKKDLQVKVHASDGYQLLSSLLPPKERRGMVLIDPPYESNDEWNFIIKHVHSAYKKWATGMYAIWFPIKDKQSTQLFYKGMKSLGAPHLVGDKKIEMRHSEESAKDSLAVKIMVLEFYVLPHDVENRMNGSGLMVINPPWQFEHQAEQLLNLLVTLLAQNQGSYNIHYL